MEANNAIVQIEDIKKTYGKYKSRLKWRYNKGLKNEFGNFLVPIPDNYVEHILPDGKKAFVHTKEAKSSDWPKISIKISEVGSFTEDNEEIIVPKERIIGTVIETFENIKIGSSLMGKVLEAMIIENRDLYLVYIINRTFFDIGSKVTLLVYSGRGYLAAFIDIDDTASEYTKELEADFLNWAANIESIGL